ncbi:MAG: YbfB/YjiJ family MFS transporter [Pseudomonadota bacterium]
MNSQPKPVLLAIGGALAFAGALGIGRFIYTPILPHMVEAAGLTTAQAGLIASANYLGYLIGALAGALPNLPGSRRRWLLWSLLVSIATTASVGLISSLAWFLILRFVGGVASAFVMVLTSVLVLERLRSVGRPQLASLQFSGVGFGIAGSALLVAALVGAGWSWEWHWLAGGLVAAIGAVGVFMLVPDREVASGTTLTGERRPGLRRLIIAYGLFGFGYIITATFIVAIVRESPAISPLEPVIWLVVGLSGAPSLLLWTWVGEKLGLVQAFALACLVEAIGVAASVLWISVPGIILAAIFLGGTFMGITAVGLIAARDRSGADPRQVMAWMTAAFGVGQIVGPSLAGALHDYSGSFQGASLLAASALVIASLLGWSVARIR